MILSWSARVRVLGRAVIRWSGGPIVVLAPVTFAKSPTKAVLAATRTSATLAATHTTVTLSPTHTTVTIP